MNVEDWRRWREEIGLATDTPIYDELAWTLGDPVAPVVPLSTCPHQKMRFAFCRWCAGYLC